MHCVSFLGRSRKNKTNHTQYVSQMASVRVYIYIYYTHIIQYLCLVAHTKSNKSNPPRMATFLNELPIFRQSGGEVLVNTQELVWCAIYKIIIAM